MSASQQQFVSRAGVKLAHALDEFKFDVNGLTCADFGCNVGGFTDCLLQRGAAHVVAIDTGYGTLDWKLRNDPRVTVMERTNALHAELKKVSDTFAGVDLVTIDLGWTPQRHAVPAALRWLKPVGRIITLIKPHYELADVERRAMLHDGKLNEDDALHIMQRVVEAMPELGVDVVAHTRSPLLGGASKGKAGNVEFLALLQPNQR